MDYYTLDLTSERRMNHSLKSCRSSSSDHGSLLNTELHRIPSHNSSIVWSCLKWTCGVSYYYNVIVLLLLLIWTDSSCAWRMTPEPNLRLSASEISAAQVQTFEGNKTGSDYFKIILTDGDSLIIGARNFVYNISLLTLQENKRITWYPGDNDVMVCKAKGKSMEQCQNYIRVIVKKDDKTLYICGTNAFNPKCRAFTNMPGIYEVDNLIESGQAKCSFDPSHNSTATYADGKLYTGTLSDFNDPIIYSEPLRTVHRDSQVLNDPDFVNSFEYQNHVYFFFRERAVEYINCGKATYSRVGRVCKNDNGGKTSMQSEWTSFFKTRLNCSIPGDFPFYFNEIQSTTEQGRGNFFPNSEASNKTDMIYAVFNTPVNSISGSAVCAFRFRDMETSFHGAFKEQASAHHNWLPVPENKAPHHNPASQCANDSMELIGDVLNFIKEHPLMDEPVPAFGGEPILIQTSFQFRLTQIAVDWQVKGADGRYYDMLFLGTDDGRVIKAVNKGIASQIETVIIEDIQVFPDHQPIISLKIYRNTNHHLKQEKLVVISQNEIKSIPLERCRLHNSCGKCVALQDPYCSWTAASKCERSNIGVQDLDEGYHEQCAPDPALSIQQKIPRREMTRPAPYQGEQPEQSSNYHPIMEPNVGASTETNNKIYSAESMAIAVVLCIFFSLVVGFALGYFFTVYFNKRQSLDSIEHRKVNIEKSNRYVEHDANHYTEPYPEKQLNVVFNPLKDNKLPNGSAETKVQPQKAKKVYL